METKIANDCKDIGNRLSELCKVMFNDGKLTTENVNELMRIMVTMTSEYKALVDRLYQSEQQMKEWQAFWDEEQPFVEQLNFEQGVMNKFLDARNLRQEYIDFAKAELAQMQLKVLEGGRNDGKD